MISPVLIIESDTVAIRLTLLCLWAAYLLGALASAGGHLLMQRGKDGEEPWRERCVQIGHAMGLGFMALAGAVGAFVATQRPFSVTIHFLDLPWFDTAAFPVELLYRLDPLARFFLGLISLSALLTALYSFRYLSPKGVVRILGPRRVNLSYIVTALNLFLFSMTQAVLADHVMLFLIAWELMTLTSAIFLIYPWSKTQAQEETIDPSKALRRGRLALGTHLVAGQLSTLLLVVGLLWPLGQMESMALSLSRLPEGFEILSPGSQGWVFALLLLGFGIKAAMVPTHGGLPWVHPSVPGNANSLLSAVGVKVGLYGVCRLLIEVCPRGDFDSPSWPGLVVLVLGGLTALLGVEYAIAEHDLKRILAYHTVENVGIILMGLGLASLAQSLELPRLAAIALAMALFHVLAHALFKGLLLLATAAIEMRTGTARIDELGGLFRRMGWTASFFLVGALSISAVPPLMGFASEWLLLRGLVTALGVLGSKAEPMAIIALLAAFLMLAHAVVYTAFCFAKICGLILVGAPRSKIATEGGAGGVVAEPGSPPGFGMGLTMALLAGACLAFGLAPGWLLQPLWGVANSLGIGEAPPQFAWHALPRPGDGADAFSPGFLVLPLLLLGLLLAVILRSRYRGGRRRATWNCGADYQPASIQADPHQLVDLYTYHALFIKPQKRAVGAVDSSGDESARKDGPPCWEVVDETPRWVVREVVATAYGRCASWSVKVSGRLAGKVQNGDLRLYLGYLLAAMVVVFLLFTLWPQGS